MTAPLPEAEAAARDSIRAMVNGDTFQSLETFVAALTTWGASLNLVSAADRGRVWSRHVADSLQLVALAEGAGPRWIDLGSGAGFPGLVVAMARPETVMTLVESNAKKAAFLIQAASASGVRVKVEPRRAEAFADEPFDVVSARALAPLPKLLTLAERFFEAQTLGLFPKGQDVEGEIEAVTAHRFSCVRHPSVTDAGGTILALTNLQKV
ncbi:MAG: 16S rRNA (guanine(527)-N(7))-methyltransferase RsmG [Pseudomonadota bacterium]